LNHLLPNGCIFYCTENGARTARENDLNKLLNYLNY